MTAQILTQSTHFPRTQPKAEPCGQAVALAPRGSASFAKLSVVYGEKAVAEAQTHLQVVLEFKVLKPRNDDLYLLCGCQTSPCRVCRHCLGILRPKYHLKFG